MGYQEVWLDENSFYASHNGFPRSNSSSPSPKKKRIFKVEIPELVVVSHLVVTRWRAVPLAQKTPLDQKGKDQS